MCRTRTLCQNAKVSEDLLGFSFLQFLFSTGIINDLMLLCHDLVTFIVIVQSCYRRFQVSVVVNWCELIALEIEPF